MVKSSSHPQIVLHLGAHKTASTHLQLSLREAGNILQDAGVRFYGPESLRKLGHTLAERFGFPFDPTRARDDTDPLAELERMADGAGRIVFSEENFAGNFQRGWGKVPLPLYPQAPERITKLSRALGRKIDVCIAVRHPSDFLASIYSQILLSGKDVTPDEFLVRNMPSEVDWSNYIADLRQAEGTGALTVWRYEDYGVQFNTICTALVGEKAGPQIAPVEDRAMPRLSEAAVGAVLSQRVLGNEKRPVRDIAIELPATPDNPPFELFDPDLRSVADDYYMAQVAAIGETPGVTLLRP
ncbi:hypothetical protein [Yoonia sp. 208BN28-4]|uniref:hypothetical protein n=1 Tax=Yoonia sp. 208BN28-4 TaxID=3126505 RepID=UPI0030A7A8F8